jgi:hypothetical protein
MPAASLLILLAGLIVALAGVGTDHLWWVAGGTLAVGVQIGRAVERIVWAVRLVRQRLRSTMDQVRAQAVEALGIGVLAAVVIGVLYTIGTNH